MITFFAAGLPKGKGSFRGFVKRRKGGRPYVAITNDSPKTRPWEQTVRLVAQQEARRRPAPTAEAVRVAMTFHLPRPKGLPRRVERHVKKPDADKLVRACLDAMTGVLWRDDAQVDELHVRKTYALNGRTGVAVVVTT